MLEDCKWETAGGSSFAEAVRPAFISLSSPLRSDNICCHLRGEGRGEGAAKNRRQQQEALKVPSLIFFPNQWALETKLAYLQEGTLP